MTAMYKILNYINRKWNNLVFTFHDFATKTNIGWLVKLSIWAHDKVYWELGEKYQLINGVSLREHELEHQLYIANHQIKYWMNYATDLQSELMDMIPDSDEQVVDITHELQVAESNESLQKKI